MPGDTVLIGPWVVSKALLDMIWPVVTTLMGAIVGGAIAHLNATRLDNRRYEREKKERKLILEREALEKALAWTDPMTLAQTQAAFEADAYAWGKVDLSHLQSNYPSSLSAELEKLDVPVHLRPLLPPNTYIRGMSILGRIERELYYLCKEKRGKSTGEILEVSALAKKIEVEIDALRSELQAAYDTTFE